MPESPQLSKAAVSRGAESLKVGLLSQEREAVRSIMARNCLTAALRLDDPETVERVARAVKSALQRETANGPIVDTTVLAQAAITALLGDDG